MTKVQVRMPDGLIRELDALADEEEMYSNRSDAVRYAVRELVQREMVGQ